MLTRNDRILLSPTDLNNYVECQHCSVLALEVARGDRAVPHVSDEGAELLRRKGEEHERDFLARLEADGRSVVEIELGMSWDFEAAALRTIDAMRSGADIIYQATFVDGQWRGRADFLLRTPSQTKLGPWGYEALDAKLARAEKPTYVLQLCFYSESIGAIQGTTPEHMHVLLGPGEQRPLRYDDFAAYYRRVRSRFETTIAAPAETEPYPVDHCRVCSFHGVCKDRWKAEDHLVQVANMRRDQVFRLKDGGLRTLTQLARAKPETEVPRLPPHSFEILRDQAALQLENRTSGRLGWHAIDCDPGYGFELLPRPSAGDIVFDIEGDPFWEPARGLHFLFGVLSRPSDGAWQYDPIWAHDRAGERRMFEQFVDLVHARLARDPGMHVYHYGTYENAALKQLMGIYATREDAVDELLRRRVLVNLHTVIRQGLRAGVESYSLKQIEALAPFAREADVRSGMQAVLAYEKWTNARDDETLRSIARYNEEDCRATLAVRDWLAARHPAAKAWADPVPHKQQKNDDTPTEERANLRLTLVEGAEAGSPRWLAGELLEYHRREARPGWWWYFQRLNEMTDDELVDDAEALGGLADTGEKAQDKLSVVHALKFPPQQHKLKRGDTASDPATKRSAGTIESIDDATGTLRLRRGPKLSDDPLPRSIIPDGPYDTRAQQEALARLATSVSNDDGRYSALRDILARSPPRILGRATGAEIQTTDEAAQRNLARDLDSSYLFIQGPPGTGKTWTGARIICELMRQGRRVGVTATSHKAIHKLLDEVRTAAEASGLSFRGLKKASGKNDESCYDFGSITSATENARFEDASAETLLFAGTAWLFAHRTLDDKVDTLVIDEAGQVSLADALAMGTSARNIVLLGDPLQLSQVSQGTHPPGTEKSVLEHLLGEHLTVPADRGLFLEHTRRMHPDVCEFISEIVYDSRLRGIPELGRQRTAFGTGLRFLPVEHAGNASASREEVAAVVAEIGKMIGAAWIDRNDTMGTLQQSDFMVVAPYNRQVRLLREGLGAAGLPHVEVGTVDKFQGREAPVVLYSMTTSSVEDVPRSLEFLFSRNRLNVAISRAMCLAFIVASPRLLESRARTIDQMRLINALCRFTEMAAAQARRTPAHTGRISV